MNAHPTLSFLTFSVLSVTHLSLAPSVNLPLQYSPYCCPWGLCCAPQASTQPPCLAPSPSSLPGSCVHTLALLPLKWLLFWKRAERIPAPVWSTYWKCLTDSQQLLGYLRLREWWVIEVFFTSGMPDPVSLCTQWREVICKPSVKDL